jgi:hypothetical protein
MRIRIPLRVESKNRDNGQRRDMEPGELDRCVQAMWVGCSLRPTPAAAHQEWVDRAGRRHADRATPSVAFSVNSRLNFSSRPEMATSNYRF